MNKILNIINDENNNAHTLVIGPTGSKKTEKIVIPSIKMIADRGESIFINDCKEEIYQRLNGYLKKKGYNIIYLNFRNPDIGNSWNMLHLPYEFYINGDIDKACEFTNDIANYLVLSDGVGDDPFWSTSACNSLFGLIMLLFKYCKEHNKDMKYVNINNILKLKNMLFSNKKATEHMPLWKYAKEDKIIKNSLSGLVYAPTDTANSILSVLDSSLRTLSIQPSLLEMLSYSDFKINDVAINKTAVFVITHDEKRGYEKIESLFLYQCYDYFIRANTKKKSNCVNFILDDLTSSLSSLRNLPSMILSSGHRNVRFLLTVSSRKCLDNIYGNEAETIVLNCRNLIVFPNRDFSLYKELKELLDSKYLEKLKKLDKDNNEVLFIVDNKEPIVEELSSENSLPKSNNVNYIKRRERVSLDNFIFNLNEFQLDDPTRINYESNLDEIMNKMNEQLD